MERFRLNSETRTIRKNWYGFFVALFILVGSAMEAQAQSCPLACNNNVQVSMDDDCSVTITPEMILEGAGAPGNCTYVVSVLGSNNQPIPTSPVVTRANIGQTLRVRISLGANSCWGTITIEDKLAPVIDCLPDLTVSCYENPTLTLPVARDNCTQNVPVTIVSNVLTDLDCTNEFSAIRTITYRATDGSGNVSQDCIRRVFFRREGLTTVVFPRNIDDVDLPSFECDNTSEWDLNGNNYPDPAESGVPTNTNGNSLFPNVSFCELNVTFTDQRIDICPGSFKVLRQWTILDWCTGGISQGFQIIKVADKDGPIVSTPNEFSVNTDPYRCAADVLIPAPIVIFDCSTTSYTVQYMLADSNGEAPVNGVYISDNVVPAGNGQFRILNLPAGRTWIRYRVVDACGNITFAFTEVDVIDNIPPIPVCKEFTVVTLTSNGFARIFALSFDNGSHDNCSNLTYEVARTTPGCGFPLNTFGPSVDFCCADVGRDIMITLRVRDIGGNSNTCMVIARVQDKLDPIITCPANITVECDTDIQNLAITGQPTAMDNCGTPTVTRTDTGSLDQCGLGVITRRFTVTDAGGRSASCTQTITVRNTNPFRASDITWPQNVELNGCLNVDSDPSVTGRPVFTHKPCSLVASTFTDQLFNFVDGACFKILRTWTVIDWCTFDQSNPSGGGLYQYTQVIKLNNTVRPVFDNCNPITECAFGENCDGFITLIKNATDDCTPSNELKFTFQVDLGNNGTIDRQGLTNNASGTFPVGVHRLNWTVEDGCGNRTTCSQLLTVNDCKKPTPYCISEITTVIMPSSGSVDIWASDFNLGSFDNCPGTLIYSFSSNVTETSRTFTCANLGINTLEMWVTDAAGNKEFCTVRINIQSNGGCGNSRVAGRLATEEQVDIPNVEVGLQNKSSNETMVALSNTSGKYEFQGMINGTEYDLRAEKDGDYGNGVSTLDLVVIQRHILGTQKLTSPFKMIAADVNANGSISASDLVELRRVILGISNKFSNNKSWRFVEKGQSFANPNSPWPFNEEIGLMFVGNDMMANDFVAVKIGDVNGTAVPSGIVGDATETRNMKTFGLEFENQTFTSGTPVSVAVSTRDFANITGLQYSLNFNQSVLDFVGIESGAFKVSDENIGTQDAEKGMLHMSWSDPAGVSADGEILFVLNFVAKANGNLAQNLHLANAAVAPEAYTDALETMKLDISPRSEAGSFENGFALYQNTPNPFSNETMIKYFLPEQGQVTLSFFDVTGKTIRQITKLGLKGLNQEKINDSDIAVDGVVIYQLEYNGFTQTKKMIKLAR